MKRLVVAFAPRRHDSESAAQDVKTRPAFLSKPSPAVLHVPNHVNAYSSSSSDGSAVQTPDPDDELDPASLPLERAASRWSSWIRSRPSSSKPKSPHAPPSSPDSDDDSDHYDQDLPLPPPPPLIRPPRPSPSPPRSPARPSRALQPVATSLRSHMNIRAITMGSIIPPLSPPPLLHLPSGPLFPRSSNPSSALQPIQSTRTVLHKTLILRRLEGQSLSRSENESIAPFGHRPKHIVPKARRRPIDEEAVSDVKKVSFYSRGLQVWLDRPCFEERVVLWTWDPHRNNVVSRRITGSDKAVASLEFSEQIEALAGYGLEPFPSITAPVPRAPTKSTLLPPLRITSPPPFEVNSAGSSTPNASTGPPTPTNAFPVSAAPRKSLRFLPGPDPEDEEDNVPLAYQVLTKRENERIIEERERQLREEDRMKKVYAAEVAAARARREGSRAGDAEKEKAKDRRSSYTRPAYDPSLSHSRRIASESDMQSRPYTTSRPASIQNLHVRSGPSSVVSVRTGGPSALRTPPLPSPPPHVRSQTMPSNEDLHQAKLRRRMSNFSDGEASTRSRAPSAPTAPAPPSMHPRPLPRSYSSNSAVGAMSMMPMPVPPVPVMAMPMYVMAGVPQYFMQQQAMMQHPQAPLLPPVRPGLPLSRSAEGLQFPRSHHSGRQDPNSGKPSSLPRRSTGGVEDTKRPSRTSVQVPPVSFRQSPPNHSGGSSSTSRGLRPTPLSQ